MTEVLLTRMPDMTFRQESLFSKLLITDFHRYCYVAKELESKNLQIVNNLELLIELKSSDSQHQDTQIERLLHSIDELIYVEQRFIREDLKVITNEEEQN